MTAPNSDYLPQPSGQFSGLSGRSSHGQKPGRSGYVFRRLDRGRRGQ